MTCLLSLLPVEILLHEVGSHLDLQTKILMAECRLLPFEIAIDLLCLHWRDRSFTERRTKFLTICWHGKRMAIFVAGMALQRPQLFDLYGFNRLAVHMVHRGLPEYQDLLRKRWELHTGRPVRSPWFEIQTEDFKLVGVLIDAIERIDVQKTKEAIERLDRRFYCSAEEIEHRINQIDRKIVDRLNKQTDDFSNRSKAQNRLWYHICYCDEIYHDKEIPTSLNIPIIDRANRIPRPEKRDIGLLWTRGALWRLQRDRYMVHHSPPHFLARKFTKAQCQELYRYAARRGLDEWIDVLKPIIEENDAVVRIN